MKALCSATKALRAGRGLGRRRKMLGVKHTREFLNALFGLDMHAARIASLANGVAGVLAASVLSIHAIGQAYALLAGIKAKSGIKQIDRLLSNAGVEVAAVQKRWVEFVVGARTQIVVALDWTEFDDDDQTTLCAYLLTRHGRATPLVWKTVRKSELAGGRNEQEDKLLERLRQYIAESVQVTIVADRGFGDQKRYEQIRTLRFDYIIRFRQDILLTDQFGEQRPAIEWLHPSGRARMLKKLAVTADCYIPPAIVLVHDKRMKESWCIATSREDLTASEVVRLYGRRFSIEETFRDTKDLHFGMGLKATHITQPERRDRMLLLVAMAHALLTLLGAASEATGMDAYLKANTVKRRTHSLFRQGSYWYQAIPNMRQDWLRTLMTAFDRIVRQHAVFQEAFGVL